MNNRSSSSKALEAPNLRHRTELPGEWLYLAREFPRKRWRELLFDQVSATLDDPTPEEIKSELAELLGSV